ncbi:LysE family transporter [Seohaeicola zhoushanensis]|uniref:Threonine efflux protein n=1 Tax=Seohaeicola zhoushanensis TaxID=1569283 RepID=A0A8J3GVP5_9RHOB|nr:LysE family transporter [Seohaeicola zhoushanensis]GHF40161.1 threonine efflux protein [Seohaeicola zhoushanensis]
MLHDINLAAILAAALIASCSPGPATLAIAGTSLERGRAAGLALASGITTGSLIWSVAAAAGLGALMHTHAWTLEVVRYVGAAYLMFLAFKSARAAIGGRAIATRSFTGSRRRLYLRGLALHLTNPKAILFFGALYSIAIPAGTPASALVVVILAVFTQSLLIFHGWALLFSVPVMTRSYLRLRRGFEAAFALGFGALGLRILTARFT